MVAKGAWLSRPQIIRPARATNRHDVQQEKVRQLGAALSEWARRGHSASEIRKAIMEVSEQ